MKKINLMLLISCLTFLSIVSAKGGSITIESNDLKGGGTEFVIAGSPDVISKTEHGTIYSNTTQIISLKNGTKVIYYSGDVNFDLEKHQLILRSNEMTDKGNGFFSFGEKVYIETYNKSGGSTFSCSATNTVVQDGVDSGESSVTYQNVVTVDCSAGGMPKVSIK